MYSIKWVCVTICSMFIYPEENRMNQGDCGKAPDSHSLYFAIVQSAGVGVKISWVNPSSNDVKKHSLRL